MNNVNQELGRASPYNQQIALNDSVVRTLFQKASGAISISDGYGKSNTTAVTFTYNTTWYVPAGVNTIRVKMWGGGGGGGHIGTGGGGGYADFYVGSGNYGGQPLIPGTPIEIFVGPEGNSNVDNQESCGVEPGICLNPNNWGEGGSGTGIRRVQLVNNVVYYQFVFIVGGGGGGSEANGGGSGNDGSADGSYSGGLAGSSTNGTYHNYGFPAYPTIPTTTENYCAFTDCGTLTGRWGGGGGGGFRNGNPGAGLVASPGGWGRGGGGGGGMTGTIDTGPYFGNVITEEASARIAGGTTDPYYSSSFGNGGFANSPGYPGKVVIIY